MARFHGKTEIPSSEVPERLGRSPAYHMRDRLVMTGWGRAISRKKNTQQLTDEQPLQVWVEALDESLKWSLETIEISDEGYAIAQAILDGTAVAVSDGSYKEGRGTGI